MMKRIFALVSIAALSMTVAADCRQTCQEEYEECLQVSKVTAKEGICAQRLRDCNLKCATDGE